MPHLILRALLCTLLVAFVMPPTSVSAKARTRQSKVKQQREFKRYVDQAVKAYKEERFEEAIVFFEKALKLKPEYRLHWNLAILYERTDQLKLSLFHMDEFLKDPKLKSNDRSKVQTRRAKILQLIEDKKKTKQNHFQARSNSYPVPTHTQTQPSPNPTPTPTPNFTSIQTQPAQGFTTALPEPQLVEVERVRISDSSPSRGIPAWGYWMMGGVLVGGSSLAVHLYANSIWEDRPNTLAGARDAQSEAYTFSLIGDILLVGSLASVSIAIWKWSDSNTSQSMSAYQDESDSSDLQASKLTLTPQGLIWSGQF